MEQLAQRCIAKIRELDFESLPISEYNRLYINRLLPQLEYCFSIYIQAISLLSKHNPANTFIVDFGGGHGFLSLFLKSLGYRVIYCDRNPLSVETIKLIKETLSEGPDFIVEGSASDLKSFCLKMDLNPDFLIATDLIEHIYDLSAFFLELKELNPSFEMIFTTGSNPVNHYKCRKLRKYMLADEKEYFLQRREFIRQIYPEVSIEKADALSRLCRGKVYTDIKNVIDLYRSTGILPEESSDQFNTCDPSNGNWTERILPFNEYTRIAKNTGFQTSFYPGFYNELRKKRLFSIIFCMLNRYIKRFPRTGWNISPYVLIRLSSSDE